MNKKLLSGILAASMLAGAAAPLAFAADFGVGVEYRTEEDAAARAQTQSLYGSRSTVLKQAEDLGRGLVAVPAKDGGILVSWRYLGTDSSSLTFEVYRNDEKIADVSDTTNYLDKDGKSGDTYKVKASDGSEDTAAAWDKEYKSIPVKKYDKGKYIVDDASVGDLDGDGEYEIIVRRTPSDYFNQLNVDEATGKIIDTREAYPLVEAYEMDGTYMWTLDIGKNEANEIDVNFLVYDFDGDGKAEVVMRSYDGMTDGTGKKIGIADADYTQSLQKQKDRQYFAEGNEYLSVFDGETGAEIARTDLLPVRDPLSSWSDKYTDTSRLTKRASHYLLTTAYLNGETPSIVMVRGAWDAVKLAAWDYKNGEFTNLWQYDSSPTSRTDNLFNAWYHSVAVADVDFDGKDEILSGAGAVDDDGTFMYATYATVNADIKLGHGDAFDVAKMTPDYDGYYVWACHETKELPANIDLHDARTGQVIYGFNKPKDTGRSRAADIDPTSRGWEVWGSTGTPLMSFEGKQLVEGVAEELQPMLENETIKLGSGEALADGWNTFRYRYADGTYVKDDETGQVISTTLPMNFKAFWDGDLLSELVDGTTISKYNWNDKCVDILYEAFGSASNNGTKAVPCLTADIFGDWREEIIWRDAANTELRIYATPYETDYKIPTLMHDITYREAIAWQNNHYNQPANTSFYMGAETTSVPAPEIKTVSGKVNPDLEAANVNHLELPILTKTPASEDNNVILKIGKSQAIANGEKKAIDSENADVVPVITEEGRTIVPLRFISENFGAEVEWNGDAREITITLGDTVIKMTIDSTTYTVNGEEKTLDASAQIYNDRTMVPVRAVLESLSKQLYWEGENRLVIIGDDVENADDTQVSAWINASKDL
ncbi:MAG: stalk domain-containing protein [Hominilimicola sp.]